MAVQTNTQGGTQVTRTAGPQVTPARTPDLRQTNLARRLPAGAGGITDPNTLPAQITPENTLRGQRLGFGVQAAEVAQPDPVGNIVAPETVGAIQAAFQAQLPQLNQQFADESEALAKRTSALGRTGSGQFNKETGFIGDRARQAREALLGNLAFNATQADAGRALAAEQANLSSGLAQQNLAAQIAQSNAGRVQNVDFAQQNFLQQLQQREDALAQQALQARLQQLGLLQSGFSGDPTGAVGIAAQTGLQSGQQFGANAGQINAQNQGLTSEVVQAILNRQNQQAAQTQVPQGPIIMNDASLGTTA